MAAISVSDAQLDAILALQMAVAWAGEDQRELGRLGWWKTTIVDSLGGGDLFAKLLPKTSAWAGLEAVRTVAMRLDQQERATQARPDRLLTLFHWGPTIDERLADRLLAHKHSGTTPDRTLPLPLSLGDTFAVDAFMAAIALPDGAPPHKTVPGGRQLDGDMPPDAVETARRLAAALLPLSDRYPMPFYRLPE